MPESQTGGAKKVVGDLVEMGLAGQFDVIIHCCNCFNNFGSGIAATIRQRIPAANAADQATRKGDKAKMGTCTVGVQGGLTVVNAYAQYRFGRPMPPGGHLDEAALARCLAWVRQHYPAARIGLPKLGAVRAGGNWARIQAIIARELGSCDVTLVIFPGEQG